MQTKNISLVGTLAAASIFLAVPRADARPDGERGGRGGPGHRPPPLEDFDANKDGQITKAEFVAGHEERMERSKERRGEDFDEERAAKRIEKIFSRLDKDGDGVISEDEMEAAKERRREGRGKDGNKDRGGKQKGRGPAAD